MIMSKGQDDDGDDDEGEERRRERTRRMRMLRTIMLRMMVVRMTRCRMMMLRRMRWRMRTLRMTMQKMKWRMPRPSRNAFGHVRRAIVTYKFPGEMSCPRTATSVFCKYARSKCTWTKHKNNCVRKFRERKREARLSPLIKHWLEILL